MGLQEESLELIRGAAQVGATLRLFGGLAVQLLVTRPALARVSPCDIDFVGLSCELPELLGVFRKFGYVEDLEVRRLFGSTRRIFQEPQKQIKIDLCLDVLLFARPIDVRQRLEVRPFTLSVADLLLSKLQPRKITQKDLVDVCNLLFTFLPGRDETAAEFNLEWLVGSCSIDWCLYKLVIDNLSESLSFGETLPPHKEEELKSRVRLLEDRLRKQPKSLRWKLRSFVGEHLQYWNEVSE